MEQGHNEVGFPIPSSACGLYLGCALREWEPNSTQGVCGSSSRPPTLLSAFSRSFHLILFISYHIISYQGFLVRPLLREPRPQVHYKSQPDATAQKETQKSTNVKSLTKIEWFQQFSELDRTSHGADVVGQSVPGGRTRMWESPLAELRAQPW